MTMRRVADEPEQRNLLPESLSDAARRVVKGIRQDVEESGWSLDRLAERLQRDPAQLSRILDGKGANPPADLLAWAAENGPNRRTLAVLSDLSGCVAPRPKPPAEVKHWFAAQCEVLDEMGIGEIVRERARLKLPKYLAADEGRAP
jgi:transcriptional regulator with XRE-family HTH domain